MESEQKREQKESMDGFVTFLIAVMMVVTGSANTLAAKLADLVRFESDSCVDKFDWPPKSHAAEVGAFPPDYKPTYAWPYNEMCPGGQPDDPPMSGSITVPSGLMLDWSRFEPDTSKDGMEEDGKSLSVDFMTRIPAGRWLALGLLPCGGNDRLDTHMCNDERNGTLKGGDIIVAYATKAGECGVVDMHADQDGRITTDSGEGCPNNVWIPFAACHPNPDGSVNVTLRRYAETQDWSCDQRLAEHGFMAYGEGPCNASADCRPGDVSQLDHRTERVRLLPEDAYGSICPKEDYRCEFNHPFLQADLMFLGEFFCFIAYFVARRIFPEGHPKNPGAPGPEFKYYLFALPACCDIVATSLMYVGLTMIYSSIFQMLRGSVVIFTMFFSYVYFRRRPHPFQYLSAVLILLGLALVGISTFISKGNGCGAGSDAEKMMLGCILIVAGQIVQALQMVIEEKFLGEHNVPALLAVGLEGCFGLLFMSLIIIPMHWIPSPFAGAGKRSWPTQHLEDVPSALHQISCNPLVVLPLLGTSFSIAFFNFSGVMITKRVSATVRMVLDSIRTVVIWAVSMMLHPVLDGMQGFDKLQFGWQACGFVILLTGIMMYNRIFKVVGFDPPFAEPIPDTSYLQRTRKERLILLAARMGMTQAEEDDIASVSAGDERQYINELVRWIDDHRPDLDEFEVDEDAAALLGGAGQSVQSRSSNRSAVSGLGKMMR
eukprot:TRINITY_DN1036_c0_g1_i1.p1 TRINITY_DN1036_c0_g1~~TRINITY_DN1036_c0_g1_i1.p1  ORF type:complete len:746 (+),score=257.82 TRINITY_DN1036_c0_g1_i1:95-2239(+)